MYNYRKKIFPLLSAILWLSFLLGDLFTTMDTTWIKYSSICLCCLTALLGAKTPDGKLVAAALCFTLAADWFLLVQNDHYDWGITLFIIVQLLYAFRLYYLHGKKAGVESLSHRITGVFFLIIFLSLATLLFFSISNIFSQDSKHSGNGSFLLSWLCLIIYFSFPAVLPIWFYFSNLCVNTIEAFALKKHTFAIGLTLFVLCDLCVAAYNLNLLPALTGPGMWLFYLPSQVLIVLSQETEKGNLDETRL